VAKRTINWTKQALLDRIEILGYWVIRNKNKRYSNKLNSIFISAVELISNHPEIGRKISKSNARAKIVKNYIIIYDFNEYELDILTIWDTRQNPIKLEQRLKK
jgi:plasmid stabilization system protein ParE